MGKPITVTEALLRDAHARLLAQHTDWDMEFSADMAVPMRRRLVRAIAVGMAVELQRRLHSARLPGKATARQQARAWYPPPANRSPAPAAAGIDRKRAAAGERDDPPQLF